MASRQTKTTSWQHGLLVPVPVAPPFPFGIRLPLSTRFQLRRCQICIVFFVFALIFIFIDFSWLCFLFSGIFLQFFLLFLSLSLFCAILCVECCGNFLAFLLRCLNFYALRVCVCKRVSMCVCVSVYFRAKLYKCFLAASKRQHRKHHQQKRRQRERGESLAQFAPQSGCIKGWGRGRSGSGWLLELGVGIRRAVGCWLDSGCAGLTLLDVLRTMWRMRNN